MNAMRKPSVQPPTHKPFENMSQMEMDVWLESAIRRLDTKRHREAIIIGQRRHERRPRTKNDIAMEAEQRLLDEVIEFMEDCVKVNKEEP